MARLRKEVAADSEDDLPELSDLLGKCAFTRPEAARLPPAKNEKASKSSGRESEETHASENDSLSKDRAESNFRDIPLRSPFKLVAANTVQLPICKGEGDCERKVSLEIPLTAKRDKSIRQSPIRYGSKVVNYRVPSSGLTDIESSEDEEAFTDLSGFIVSDDDSIPEDSEPELKIQPRTPRRLKRGLRNSLSPEEKPSVSDFPSQYAENEIINLVSPSPKRCISDSQKSSDDSDNNPTKSDGKGGSNIDTYDEKPAFLEL